MFAVLVLTTTFSLSTIAFAQKEKVDAGKLEFDMHCAICHGMDAKGNGSYAYNLEVEPSNLTLLAKNNAGVFPADGRFCCRSRLLPMRPFCRSAGSGGFDALTLFFAVLRVRRPATPSLGEPRMVEREQKTRATIPRAGAGIAATFQRSFIGRTKIWPG
jgi:hypothetical protein